MRIAVRLFLVCVLVLTVGAGSWAQPPEVQAPTESVTPVTPSVVSGADIGFRIEGRRGQTPVVTLVIRVNGQWVPVETANSVGVKRLTLR